MFGRALHFGFCAGMGIAWLLFLGSAGSLAQKPPQNTKTPKPSTTKNANIKPGTLTALDDESVTIQNRAGEKTPYTLTDKTRFLKNYAEAQASDFQTGDTVVARLRKVRNKEEYFVFELMDVPTYEWLEGLKRNPTTGTIKEKTEDRLALTLGAQEFTYTISEKTYWSKNGKTASADEFKEGDKVTLIPRSLPGGGIWARIVSDSPQGAAQSKEQTASVLRGTLQTLDTGKRTFTFLMTGNISRTLLYNEATEVRRKSKPVTLATLRPGMKISVRWKRDTLEQELATRITIETATATTKKTKMPLPRTKKENVDTRRP
jgi:hypothetical protein